MTKMETPLKRYPVKETTRAKMDSNFRLVPQHDGGYQVQAVRRSGGDKRILKTRDVCRVATPEEFQIVVNNLSRPVLHFIIPPRDVDNES